MSAPKGLAGRLAGLDRRLVVRLSWIAGVVVLGLAFALLRPFWQLAGQFGREPLVQPSRLYARPLELRPGLALGPKGLLAVLDSLGYRRVEAPPGRGSYLVGEGWVEVARRPLAWGGGGGGRLRVVFRGQQVERVELDGREAPAALLDPPLVASFYGPELRERRPVGVDALPEELVLSVLAAEDVHFLDHVGISITGILRAAWVNLREGEVKQGGSTLTQQLVKNLFLSPERTLWRKVQEAILAIAVELRFDKRQILEAYLNEIYFGRSGPIHLMGIGAASWAYFGKDPSQLDLAESALLAGLIQSPVGYSPLAHPERAIGRRNEILSRLGELEWIDADDLERAAATPLGEPRPPLVGRHAPYFCDFVAREAARRFGLGRLEDAGFALLSTLDAEDQRQAEAAVAWGAEALEGGWEKGRKVETPLQVALVSVDPVDGGLRAYVGGRDYAASQFDRVGAARRQAGSSFKPVVYAAAFRDRVANPATFLEDAPMTVLLARQTWSPQNSDGRYRGDVSARTALEHSLNVPTARLAMQTGLPRVAELAQAMGIETRLDPYPALALGAMEVSPLEEASVYATLAAGGVRPALHALDAVYDRAGAEIRGQELEPRRRVLPEAVAYLVTRILQGVVDRGTGVAARTVYKLDGPLAGKTGTTNDRRDSWFAGYSPLRATVVWVGYDDNARTRLSGTRAALPIWARFTARVRPPGGHPDFVRPPGVVEALIDPTTGGFATDRCPEVAREVFLVEYPPSGLCPEHGGWGRPLEQEPGLEVEDRRHPFRRWLDLLRRRGNGT